MAQPTQLVAVPTRIRLPEPGRPTLLESVNALDEAARAPRVGGAARWFVRVLVLGIAVAAPAIVLAGQRDVALDVDGKVRTVRTYASSPHDLLVRRGVESARNDRVRGGITHGKVSYRRGKVLRIVLDGRSERVVAHGLTVREALAGLGLVPGPKDHVFPAPRTRLRPGMALYVRNAVHAKVRVDGDLRDVVSSGDTVGRLLTQAGIRVGDADYVIPATATEPQDGMWIRVVRVQRIVEERSTRLPFQIVTRRSPSMESGARRVVQQGAEGLLLRRYVVRLEDGRRVQTALLEERTVRPVRNHIVNVGTKEPSYRGGGGAQSGLASWYHAEGLVAAHRSLPMGSIVHVTNTSNGRSVNVRIADRGPTVEGRVIDLSDDAFERLAPLGEGTIKVKIQS